MYLLIIDNSVYQSIYFDKMPIDKKIINRYIKSVYIGQIFIYN